MRRAPDKRWTGVFGERSRRTRASFGLLHGAARMAPGVGSPGAGTEKWDASALRAVPLPRPDGRRRRPPGGGKGRGRRGGTAHGGAPARPRPPATAPPGGRLRGARAADPAPALGPGSRSGTRRRPREGHTICRPPPPRPARSPPLAPEREAARRRAPSPRVAPLGVRHRHRPGVRLRGARPRGPGGRVLGRRAVRGLRAPPPGHRTVRPDRPGVAAPEHREPAPGLPDGGPLGQPRLGTDAGDAGRRPSRRGGAPRWLWRSPCPGPGGLPPPRDGRKSSFRKIVQPVDTGDGERPVGAVSQAGRRRAAPRRPLPPRGPPLPRHAPTPRRSRPQPAAGRGPAGPRWSRRAVPAYSARKAPCSWRSGTPRSTNGPSASGVRRGTRAEPPPASPTPPPEPSARRPGGRGPASRRPSRPWAAAGTGPAPVMPASPANAASPRTSPPPHTNDGQGFAVREDSTPEKVTTLSRPRGPHVATGTTSEVALEENRPRRAERAGSRTRCGPTPNRAPCGARSRRAAATS